MNQFYVKIVLYKNSHADQTIYFRNKLPMNLIDKYRWYFDYLAARVKVAIPREKVELSIGSQEVSTGKEYIEQKTKDLLIHKRSQLNKLCINPCPTDLFNIGKEEVELKKQRLEREISDLENGIFNYWVPEDYINKLKNFI